MRVIFMGTPDFSVAALHAVASQHEIVGVFTREPKPQGRGMKLTPSPVHQAAERLGLPIFTPKNLKTSENQALFLGLEADIAVVVAYGLILPKVILEHPTRGCYNIHASLLPRWRGAAPIHRAIEAGDKQTGITIMQMDEGLDTGDMLLSKALEVSENMNCGQAHDALAQMGASLILEALNHKCNPVKQPLEGVTYAHKITNEEARLDWSKSPLELHNKIRGFSPFPGCFAFHGGERVKILESQLEKGELKILRVQKAGSKACAYEDFLRGQPQGASWS